MDNIRFALLCALGVLGFMLFQAWQADYGTAPTPAPTQQTQTSAAREPVPGSVPGLSAAPQAGQQNRQTATNVVPRSDTTHALASGETIRVTTDKMEISINTHGGGLRLISLKHVPISAQKPNSSLNLINDSLPNFFIVQSGLAGKSAPNHNSVYHARQLTYRMEPGQNVLRVPLTWSDGNGHKVTKVYVFHRGSYKIGLDHEIANDTDTPWRVSQYVRFWRTPFQRTAHIPFEPSPLLGVGWYEAVPGKPGNYRYDSRSHDDLADDPLKITQQGGWIAMVQHYFIGAAIPPDGVKVKFLANSKNVPGASNGFRAGFITAPRTVAPEQQTKLDTTLFIGPKLDRQLAAVAPGLDLTINYGWFTVLAKPIFWVLAKIHIVAGNWGVSIILLTILIKLLFYKLSEKQYRSMARMRKFAPRMKQLKEKYGDDKQMLQSKMMELYKKEGFNPLGGCWPMLVQMPVFIALYWMLRGAVELRLAPFLWIHDLASPDPYYILPIIYAIAMFFQQRLQTSVTMDPMQQKMMQIMPLGMAVFFAFFPAGLVLYYCVNSILSIAQQWYIYRKLDAEGLGHSAHAK